MKRFLAVLLAAVISLSSFGVAAFAADNGGISEFSIISALDDLNEKGAQKRVDWFFNENDGCYYLFVPSSMSTDTGTSTRCPLPSDVKFCLGRWRPSIYTISAPCGRNSLQSWRA